MAVKINRDLKNGELKTIVLAKHGGSESISDGSDNDSGVESSAVTPAEGYYTYNAKDIPEIPFIANFPDYGKFVINGYNEETKAYSGVGSDSDGSLTQCLLIDGIAQYGPVNADSTNELEKLQNYYVITSWDGLFFSFAKIGDPSCTYTLNHASYIECDSSINDQYDGDKYHFAVNFDKVQGKITATSPLTLSSDNKLSIDQSALQSNLTFASPLKESNGTVSIDLPSTIIPDIPTDDGTYTLKVTVASGVSTFSWVKDE